MNLSIGSWDHKWVSDWYPASTGLSSSRSQLYLVCRFTSPLSKPHENPSSSKSEGPGDLDQRSTSGSESSRCSDDDMISSSSSSSIPATLLKEKSDGTTLHCFTVSRLCFKMGRITVPPAIVMACEGFSKPPKVGSYSHASPPPHWAHPHALRNTSDSLDVYQRFLAGGWREVPEGDRWWVEPLSGPTEERRRANLIKLELIDRGVVGCMNI